MQSDKPIVFSAKRISKDFGAGKSLKTAVKDVSFDIYDEEFISIVGGSGCGKSVLAKIITSRLAVSSSIATSRSRT